jgi:hypothetical protein
VNHGTRIKSTFGVAAAVLVFVAPATAANIKVVRDVAARDARTLPIRPITVIRDVSARDTRVRRPSIEVVRDTPARDAAQAERRAAKEIAVFRANERSGR